MINVMSSSCTVQVLYSFCVSRSCFREAAAAQLAYARRLRDETPQQLDLIISALSELLKTLCHLSSTPEYLVAYPCWSATSVEHDYSRLGRMLKYLFAKPSRETACFDNPSTDFVMRCFPWIHPLPPQWICP